MSCVTLIEVSKGGDGQYLGRVVVPEGEQADVVRTAGAEDPIPQAMDDQGMALYEARDFEKPEIQEGAGKRQKDDEANSDILEPKFLPDRAENNESVEQDIERLRKAIVRNFKETTGRTIRSSPGDITRVSLRNHQALQRIADQFGAKIIGIRVNSKILDTFQGVTLRDGVIYINEKAKRPHLAILGHELGHQLRRDNPQLWQQLVDEIRPFIKKEYYGRNFPDVMGTTDPDALREEFVSEVLSDGFMSTRFWNELGKSNPSLLSRIVDLLTDLINQIRGSVGYTPKTKAYLTDYDRVLTIAGRYVGKYAPPGLGSKPDGQPKFLPNETPPSEGFSDPGDNQTGSLKQTIKAILDGQRLREVYDPTTGEYRIEGLDWKDVAGLLWRKLRDVSGRMGEQSMFLQSFSTLVDRNRHYFDKFSHNPLETLDAYRRLMQALVQKWADRYQKAQDLYKALSVDSQRRVSLFMYDSTMAGVHGDREFVADDSLKYAGNRLTALRKALADVDADQRRRKDNKVLSPEEALTETNKLKRQIRSLERRIAHEKQRTAAYEGLQKRWDKLSDKEKAVYTRWQDELDKLWNAQQRALEQKISEMSGLSAAEQNHARGMLVALRKERREQMKLSPYFPLRRFGDYQLLVRRGDGEYERYHFESRSEALDTQQHIKADDPEVSIRLLTDYKDAGLQAKDLTGVAGQLLKLFNEGGNGVTADVKEMVNRFVIENLPEVSARKAEMRRYFVRGASADMERSFAHTMLHGAHDLSRIIFSHRVQGEMDAIQEQIQLHEDLTKGQFDEEPLKKQAAEESLLLDEKDLVHIGKLFKVMRKQVDGMMNPDTNRVAAFAGNFGFFWYLAGSPGAALVNLAQVPQIAYPMLAARFGMGKSRRELMRAYGDIARSMKPVSNVVQGANPLNWNVRDSVFEASSAEHLTQDERDMLAALEKDATTDTTQANSLASVASGDGKQQIGGVALKMEKTMALMGFWFHNAEVLNRQVVQLATYRMMRDAEPETLAKIRRMHGAESYSGLDMARWMTTRTQYDYSHGNRSLFLKSNLAKTLTPLMNYSFLTLELMFTRIRDIVDMNKDPELRQLARRELAGIMGMTALMGGTRALPLMLPFFVLNMVFDDEDEPWDAESAWGEFLEDVFGETGANLVTRGVVNALPVGFDLSNRMGLANLLFGNPDVGKDSDEQLEAYLLDALGVTASTAIRFTQGVQLLGEGDYQRGFEKMVPKFVGDVSKAERYYREGVVSAKGGVVVEDISLYEALLQSQGLAPAKVARAYDQRNAVRTVTKRLEKRRRELLNRFAWARMDGRGDIAKVLQEIREFNQKNPYLAITGKQLTDSVNRRLKARQKKQATYGLYIGDMYREQAAAMGYE